MRHARLWVGNAIKIQMEGLVNGNLPCLSLGIVFVKKLFFQSENEFEDIEINI
jgi:hypothetical protein